MIEHYNNLMTKDYQLKIVFYKIPKDFIRRFNNISFDDALKVKIIEVNSSKLPKVGDIIFVDLNFFEYFSIDDIRDNYKYITFIAHKFNSDLFKSLYNMGIDNIIYNDFIDAEIRRIYSYVHTNIKSQIQNNMFNEILDKTTNVIVITDNDGNIEYVNKSFIESSGYTYDEVIGENPRVIKSDQHPDQIYEDLWETINNNQTWEGDFINLSKNGDLIYEEAIITPIIIENENKKKFIKISNNINKQKFLENKAKINISLAKNIMEKICESKVLDNRMHYDFILKYSQELGGDFVRLDKMSDNKYLLSLVDVTGHDLSSALIVMSIYSILLQHDSNQRLSTLVNQINKFLYNFNARGDHFKYATGIFIEIDLESMSLKYINAGHPSGLCFSKDKGEEILLSHNSSMLGVIENDYEPDTIELSNISSLIVYSDGILDLMSRDYDVAELKLKTYLRENKINTLEKLQNEFINHQYLPDDLTFVKLNFK